MPLYLVLTPLMLFAFTLATMSLIRSAWFGRYLMTSTSHSLLEQLQQGPDGIAWQRWHALYEPLVQGWLRRHQLIASDRDDVVQNVMTVVVRRLPEFDHNGRVGAFRNWLKTITINCLRDYWKDLRSHPRQAVATGVLDEWADDQSKVSQNWDQEHDRHLVNKLLTMLEPEFTPVTWKAFQLLVIDGKPAVLVATELEITKNAVYIAKSRVLTRLRLEAAGLVDDTQLDRVDERR